MVQPQDDKNDRIMQAREPPRAPSVGRPPEPGEVMGRHGPPFDVEGLDALSPALLHVPFPATKDVIVQLLGETRIPVDAQRALTLAEIMDIVGPREFRSRREVEQAVHEAWPRIRDAAGHAGERGGRRQGG